MAITSRELLTHTSGVRHNYGQNDEKPATEAERKALDASIRRERSTQYTRYTDVIAPLETFKNDPLLFEPGRRVQYSSLGYRVLGCVLQGAAHSPYRELMRTLVFERHAGIFLRVRHHGRPRQRTTGVVSHRRTERGRRRCSSSFPRPMLPWPSCATWTVLLCARPWRARSERSPHSSNRVHAQRSEL